MWLCSRYLTNALRGHWVLQMETRPCCCEKTQEVLPLQAPVTVQNKKSLSFESCHSDLWPKIGHQGHVVFLFQRSFSFLRSSMCVSSH